MASHFASTTSKQLHAAFWCSCCRTRNSSRHTRYASRLCRSIDECGQPAGDSSVDCRCGCIPRILFDWLNFPECSIPSSRWLPHCCRRCQTQSIPCCSSAIDSCTGRSGGWRRRRRRRTDIAMSDINQTQCEEPNGQSHPSLNGGVRIRQLLRFQVEFVDHLLAITPLSLASSVTQSFFYSFVCIWSLSLSHSQGKDLSCA